MAVENKEQKAIVCLLMIVTILLYRILSSYVSFSDNCSFKGLCTMLCFPESSPDRSRFFPEQQP